ncbi:MAG: acyl-CoA thioesterase [Salibacteraceae bacterium]
MRYRKSIQTRFRDTDMLGHVNNAVYLSYIEIARLEFIKEQLPHLDWSKQAFILARVEIDFRLPALLNDVLFAEMWVSRLGAKSFDFSYQIFKEHPDAPVLLASATTVMVTFDYATQKSIPLLPEWRELLEKYQEEA